MHLLDSVSTLDPVPAVKQAPRARRTGPQPADNEPQLQPLPRWARPQGADPGAAIFAAGAGIARFDQILRSADGGEPVFAGCLRQRLALKAAESCAMLARLREDVGALRDAEHLPGGGETSPAGRLHRLFRLYASLPARVDAAAPAAELLGLREAIDAGALAGAAAAPDPLMAAAQASAAAMKLYSNTSDAEFFAFVVADLALASRLGWARPVPLIAVAILHPSLRRGAGERGRRPRPTDDDWAESVARAYGLAVVEAHALAAELARRSQKLLVVAPMLRAKGACRVVDMLLADDGVTPAAAAARAGLSDRAARRLFDRLVMLGEVRELTGRDTFRIYGL
jgi:hypothetical protein